MATPPHSLTGTKAAPQAAAAEAASEAAAARAEPARTVGEALRESQVEVLHADLDRDVVGLAPVKQRIRDIAAQPVIDRLRLGPGLQAQSGRNRPSMRMCFTGRPGTGKTTVALHTAEIPQRPGCVRKGHPVAVTFDDLAGRHVGHIAPRTKEVLQKAMGGALFIDEAHHLHRPENERDDGQEAIEILLQPMKNQRRPGRHAHRLPGRHGHLLEEHPAQEQPGHEQPRRAPPRLPRPCARRAGDHRRAPARRHGLPPHARRAAGLRRVSGAARDAAALASAGGVRNALDRARLRQASRLFAGSGRVLDEAAFTTLEEGDIRASRVFLN